MNSYNSIRRVILTDTTPLSDWRADLQAELSCSDVLGHVFHDIRGIDPEIEPEQPTLVKGEDIAKYEARMADYKTELRAWIKGEFEVQNIIIQRLDESKKPRGYQKYSSKVLYEMIARANEVANLLPHSEAFDKFVATKFTTTADEYCTRFMHNLQNVNNAAECLSSNSNSSQRFKFTDEQAAVFFLKGTRHIKWLDIWRETKAVNVSQYASLNHMITTLRAAAGTRNIALEGKQDLEENDAISYPVAAAARKDENNRNRHKKHRKFNRSHKNDDTDQDSDDPCKLCKHDHANKDCYKQHPERAPKHWINKEARQGHKHGKAALTISRNYDTSDDEGDCLYLKANKKY